MSNADILKEAIDKFEPEEGFWFISADFEDSNLSLLENARFDVLFYDTVFLVKAEEIREELEPEDYVLLTSVKLSNVRQLIQKLNVNNRIRVYVRPTKSYMKKVMGFETNYQLSRHFDIKTHHVI